MRKLLICLIIVLLVILTYYSLAKGIKIGSFQILSISQIQEKNKQLDERIEQANRLIDTEYPNKISSWNTAYKKMKNAKEEYLNLTSISSENDIIKATMEESYAIELLWTKIGVHAKNKGVNLDMKVTGSSIGTSGLYNLNFNVQGSYLAIINFVEAIENDSILNFRINNFKLVPSSESILQATFTVNNVAIQGNTSGQNINNPSSIANMDETEN